MKCTILHESKGRIRVHIERPGMSASQADILEYYMRNVPSVTNIKVYDRTGDAIICFNSDRSIITDALSRFSYDDEEAAALVPSNTGRAMNKQFEEKLVLSTVWHYAKRIFLPFPVRAVLTALKAVKFIIKGVRSLAKGQLDVAVLDAAAITVSVLRGDFDTASSVMFLLGIGDALEEWTYKKSVADLARTMSLNVDRVWLRTDSGDVLAATDTIREGDRIVVGSGNMIPLDGRIESGLVLVNQASMTGEPLAVEKSVRDYVYAGSVVEDGDAVIIVDKSLGSGRYDRIVRMIEESEKLKSGAETRAEHLADRLVPYTLGGTVLIWLITQNPVSALSVLMVDFSCALKLSMPLAFLAAMRECGSHNISVKGGMYLESVADADTLVFDKTGTLTYAEPRVASIVTFNGKDENSMLKLAACLEEHFPHSLANAVVNEAIKRGIDHREFHNEVQYVVAHGIRSSVNNVKVVIGSYHFVFEDEGCVINEDERDRFESLSDEYTQLFLAVSGVLSAVILIEDPIRPEAADVIRSLKELGIGRIVMMTGDSERTAGRVARMVGVDEYFSEVLPEDKASFIQKEHEAGRTVVMVGDGVNDSPALSSADAGIAVSTGAAIAREVADITIASEDLSAFITLKRIADELQKRVRANYRSIISFNLLLIILGVTGVIQPATSALLHNTSTILIGLKSMTDLLPEDRK